MTNEQLYLAMGVPTLFNGLTFALLLAYMNAKFKNIEERLASINQRFDDMRDLWRAELRRLEEVLDARLKHLEGRI